jgi:hypothetical protein
MQSLGGRRKATAISNARIAKSFFILLLTDQPMMHLECKSSTAAKYIQPSRHSYICKHVLPCNGPDVTYINNLSADRRCLHRREAISGSLDPHRMDTAGT